MKKEKIVFNKNYPKLIKRIIEMAIGVILYPEGKKSKRQEILEYMADIVAEMDYIDKNCQIIKK